MYQFSQPVPLLQPYIDNFWFLRTLGNGRQAISESIFVDAKADLIFNFGVAYERIHAGVTELIAHSNLDGQRCIPISIFQSGAIELVGVRFKVGGLAPFLPMPIHLLSDAIVSVQDAFGHAILELESKLYDWRHNSAQQTYLLNMFFLQRLSLRQNYAPVQAILQQLKHLPQLSLPTLSIQMGFSVRTLNRYFQQVTGFSPHTYRRIVRLAQVLNALSLDKMANLVELALQLGYYDQAHLNKDFKAFTGYSPSEYRHILDRRRQEPPPNLVQFLQDAPHIAE